jgi:hypothetical protein
MEHTNPVQKFRNRAKSARVTLFSKGISVCSHDRMKMTFRKKKAIGSHLHRPSFHLVCQSMAAEAASSFPRTVFIKELPEEYSLTELTVLLEKYGNILEIQTMHDGHLLVRFQTGESAKRCVSSASGKKGNKFMFHGKQLHVIPKRNRK